MLPSICRATITVIRPNKEERRGSQVLSFDNAKTFKIGGCSVQPSTTNADFEGRYNTSASAILYAPPNADIKFGDRIEYRNAVYEVNGQPLYHDSPTGRLDFISVYLNEWRG